MVNNSITQKCIRLHPCLWAQYRQDFQARPNGLLGDPNSEHLAIQNKTRKAAGQGVGVCNLLGTMTDGQVRSSVRCGQKPWVPSASFHFNSVFATTNVVANPLHRLLKREKENKQYRKNDRNDWRWSRELNTYHCKKIRDSNFRSADHFDSRWQFPFV